MKLRYFTMSVAAIAFAACTDDLEWGGFANDPNAVRINVSVGEPFGRSNPAGDATTVTQFNSEDKISVSSNNQVAAYKYDGTAWTPVDESKYLTWSSAKQHFTAYYPDSYSGSSSVPSAQSTEKLIAAADYMKFEGEQDMKESIDFILVRQTARVVINSHFGWNEEYKEGGTATYKVTDIQVNCTGLSESIAPYHSGNYYALVNPGEANSEATFITLTIEPVNGGTAITHTVKGIPSFQAGHSYTYRINIGKNGVSLSDVTVEEWSTGNILPGEGGMDDNSANTFSVSVPKENFTCMGGTKSYTVTSYVENSAGNKIASPWSAKFVRKLQDGTYQEIKQGDTDYPNWITNFSDKGIGDDTDNTCILTVAPAEISNNHYTILKNNIPVSGTYNLANAKGDAAIENTANCYIINAAGTYSFPLVYGNAIKNGADNTSAYQSTATDNALENFVNHKNTLITKPYIAAHEDCIPAYATLVWQDADNLVSNIQFVDGGSPEKHCITFDVAQSTIKQGNAIIAVCDAENTILWSWHIWVTDYKPGLAATIMASYNPNETQRDKKVWSYDNAHSYTFMGVPLGWCDAESAAGHEAIIQFTQTVSGKTYEVIIKQEALNTGGNATFYQWGRKDPMLPSTGLDNVDKPYYGNYTFTKNAVGKVTVGTAIQNPHVVYDGGHWGYSDWYSAKDTEPGKQYFHNLWDANNASTGLRNDVGIKTVYDPSPVGYMVPPSGAFSGMTCDGTNMDPNGWEYIKSFNTPLTKEEMIAMQGIAFYCKGMGGKANSWNTSEGVIYFHATGQREFSPGGELSLVGNRGAFWTNAPRGMSNVRELLFDFKLGFVLAQGEAASAQSLAVRPIREQ